MTTENEKVEGAEGGGAAAGGSKQEVKGPTGAAGGAGAAGATGSNAAAAGATGSTGPARFSVTNDSEDIPEAAELLEMSPRAFKARMTRHTKKELKDKFGTDDFEDIKARLEKLTKLEASEEENRRKTLSEQEKTKEDLAKERARATAAEARVLEIESARVFDKVDSKLATMAGEFLDPDIIDTQLPRLAKHLLSEYSEKDLNKMKQSQLDKVCRDWFKDLVEAKPKFGKDFKAGDEPTKKAPLTNGARVERRGGSVTSGAGGAKTIAPGRENSMTSREAKDAAAAEGYRW